MTSTISYQDYPELGNVHRLREYDQALAVAKEQKKPVLILFQEIPGCSTCVNYGQQVMSDPTIVSVIETSFVPLVIHNNKPGADKKVLDAYREPSRNNPVMRIVDSEGKDIAPRISGIYTIQGIRTLLQDFLDKQ